MSEKPTYEELEEMVQEFEEAESERKLAEEALIRSDRKWEKAFNALSDWICLLNMESQILRTNKIGSEILDASNDQIIGRKCCELVHGSVEPVRGCPFEKMKKTQNRETAEIRFLDSDKWFMITADPLFDEEGKLTGAVHMSRDITKQKETEMSLRESEEKFRFLAENMADMIWVVDLDLDTTYVSPSIESVLGFTPEERKRQSLEEIMTPESLRVIQKLFADELQQAKAPTADPDRSISFETEYYKKDGGTICAENKVKWIQDDRGSITGILGVSRDISEHKQAEEALRESEERFKTIFEFAPDAYYLNDLDGNFIDGNKAAESVTGFKKEELIGKNFLELNLLSPEELHKATELLAKNLEGFATGPDEVTLNRKDGIQVTVEITTCPMNMGGQEIVLGIARDVSERKRLESQLQQAQKMESIGTLAGGIAHEFNNILGIIIGNTELAIDDVPEWNPAKESLKEIRKASMRAKDVVRHILSFARKTPVQRQPIQINTVMRDSLKLMRASIPTTIEIRQNISCESELILANPTEINQILMNLCTNSVHALSEETGVLEVSLESISLDQDSASQYENVDTGNFVKLTVKDTGEGIDPTIMDRVFDPYFTTKDIGKGTGMGLAIAYGIVKKYDGAIKATSELGIGTVVELLFPLIDERAEHEVKEEPEVLPAGTERILIVDDEPSMVRMVSQMLKRLGYEVVALLNPKEALELFMAEPTRFDLVITDMAMPQMAGDRLAQELMKARPDIPIILCTGHSERINEDRAKELGIKAFLKKPLVTRDFAQTVRKVLDAGRKRGKRDEGREDA